MGDRAYRHQNPTFGGANSKSSDLALEASRKALESAGIDASEIDLIIVRNHNAGLYISEYCLLLASQTGGKRGQWRSTCRLSVVDSSMR